MSEIKTKILGLGVYLPERIMHNTDLEKIVDTSDEWIHERSGIRERRISSTEGGEFPSDMAKMASEEAIKEAGLDKDKIDFILLATFTPDALLPNTASILQNKLGISSKCGCLDVSAACSGFVYALDLADSLVKTGKHKNILVVATEMLSSKVNWKDRGSCILFGDGSAAMVVGPTPEGEESDIHSSYLAADGTGKEFLESPIGGAVEPLTMENFDRNEHLITMKGRDLFKVATRTLTSNSKVVLEKAELSVEDIDWLIPHQANIRIINTTVSMLKFNPERVITNIEKYGNTSSVSIPLALYEGIKDGRVKRGQKLVFSTFGAGLTSASMVLTY